MISILKSGISSTIQGSYREGYLQYGFPRSGPADSISMRAANFLVGNKPWESCIEMMAQGPTMEFDCSLQIAICGAAMTPKINGIEVSQNQSIVVKKGDKLSFKPSANGLFAYLAIGGSMDIPEYFNSTSTYLPSNTGGYKGRQLKAGDRINMKYNHINPQIELPNFMKFIPINHLKIRVLAGPERALFSKNDIKLFYSNLYKVSSESNRIGIKTTTDKKLQLKDSDIISSAILPGTIQIPSNGLPMIMMNDHQTTGGYKRIANVISHDLDHLSQSIPRSLISFREISLGKASELQLKKENLINRLFNL